MTKTATKKTAKPVKKNVLNVDLSLVTDDMTLQRHVEINNLTRGQSRVLRAIREQLVNERASLPNGSLVDSIPSTIRYILFQAAGEI